MGPAAGVTGELAIGPFLAAILGPGPAWSLALPSDEGLPAVFDSALDGGMGQGRPPHPPWAGALLPWAEVVSPRAGCLVAAVAIAAWESLPSFHERVKNALEERVTRPGLLRPDACAASLHCVREHGVALPKALWSNLTHWAQHAGVAPLVPDLR